MNDKVELLLTGHIVVNNKILSENSIVNQNIPIVYSLYNCVPDSSIRNSFYICSSSCFIYIEKIRKKCSEIHK